MIDWDRVNELQDEVGEEDFAEVVELFLSEVEERLKLLDQNKPPNEIEEDMHFLKGSALNLGFSGLASFCQERETLAASGAPVDGIAQTHEVYANSKSAFLERM